MTNDKANSQRNARPKPGEAEQRSDLQRSTEVKGSSRIEGEPEEESEALKKKAEQEAVDSAKPSPEDNG